MNDPMDFKDLARTASGPGNFGWSPLVWAHSDE